MVRTERFTIDTSEGEGPYTVPCGDFLRATAAAVPSSSTISTAVIEIKKAWEASAPSGVSFASAITFDATGAAASENIDCTRSPFLLFDVTTFEASKEVEVVVHFTDAPDPFPLARSHRLDLSRGLIPGESADRKFGHNTDVGTSYESISELGSALDWPVAAQTLELLCSDANDTAAGSGARSVTIMGLDANFESITETLDLATTPAVATTTNSFIRVNRAFVATCGTYGGSNVGTITCTQSTSGDSLFLIQAGDGQTNKLAYTVPANHNAYIDRTAYTVDSGKSVDVRARIRLNADDTSVPVSPWRVVQQVEGLTGPLELATVASLSLFPAKTDIVAEAKVDATAAAVSGAFDIVLIDL